MDKALQYLSIARKAGRRDRPGGKGVPDSGSCRRFRPYMASGEILRRRNRPAVRPPEIHQRGNGLCHRPDQPCHRRRDGCPAGADPADGAWRTGEKPGSSGSAFRQGRKGKEASGRSESPCKKCAKREKEAVVLSSKQSAEAHIPCVPLSACHILEVRFIV